MRKPKLNDVELSKVLSRAAIGKLNHITFGHDSDGTSLSDCGCVAGTVYGIRRGFEMSLVLSGKEQLRARGLSCTVGNGVDFLNLDYGGDPDSVLRWLEAKGVA